MSSIGDLINVPGALPVLMVVGGTTGSRASICRTASGQFRMEPVASVDELTQQDLMLADLFLVWNEDALIEKLNERTAAGGLWAPIIAVSDRPSVQRIVSAIGAGALDYVDWPGDAARLGEAVSGALAAKAVVAPVRRRPIIARWRLERLSRREREVVSAMAQGMPNKAIAQHLGISPRTVEIHRANMLSKLCVKSSAEAIRLVAEAGMSEPSADLN